MPDEDWLALITAETMPAWSTVAINALSLAFLLLL